MAVQLLGLRTKFTDDQGRPLVGGSVHTYYAGTSLPQDTFSDPELTVPNTNPVKLDDTGSANIFLKGTYRVRVFDRKGKFVEDQDNVDQLATVAEVFKNKGGLNAANERIDALTSEVNSVKEKTLVVESIADLLAIKNPKNGLRVYVKSYHAGLGKGGGYFVYDSTKANVNDSGLVINGWVRQLDAAYVMPEHFGAKANVDFDNADALNKAFATGLDVYSTADKTYTVKKHIKSKGQKTVGGWRMKMDRQSGGMLNYKFNETVETTSFYTNSDKLRLIYVGTAWDLAEFLLIKSLGFNAIHHYLGFYGNPTNADVSISQMLDNAKTAGLNVTLGIELHHEALNNIGLFLETYDKHPAVMGYAVYDEPKYRDISVAAQNARIAELRKHTNKTLVTVDSTGNPFQQAYSKNYDIVFVNRYAHRGESTEQDMQGAREGMGIIKAQTGARVIPTLGTFLFKGVAMTDDVNRVVAYAKQFVKSGNGSYAAFTWDAEGDDNITSSVKDNAILRQLCIDISRMDYNKEYITDTYLFGSSTDQYDHGLHDILKVAAAYDKFSDTDMSFNAFPSKVDYYQFGNSDVSSTTAGIPEISGLFFKGDKARYSTLIKLSEYLTIFLEYAYPEAPATLASTIKLCASTDLRRANTVKVYNPTKKYEVLRDSINTNSNTFSNLVFDFKDTTSPPTSYYRQSIRGAIIVTNW